MVTVKENDVTNKMKEVEEDDEEVEEEEEKECDETCSEMKMDTPIKLLENCDSKSEKNNQIITVPQSMNTPNKSKCDDDHDDESSSEQDLTDMGWLLDLNKLPQWPIDSNTSNRKSSKNHMHSSLANSLSNCIMNDIDDERNMEAAVISEKDLSEEKFKKFTIQVKQ